MPKDKNDSHRGANNLGGYLSRRADELGLERENQLAEIQAYLDEKYGPNQCRAASINDGVLKITTRNASLASELRFDQKPIYPLGVDEIRISLANG